MQLRVSLLLHHMLQILVQAASWHMFVSWGCDSPSHFIIWAPVFLRSTQHPSQPGRAKLVTTLIIIQVKVLEGSFFFILLLPHFLIQPFFYRTCVLKKKTTWVQWHTEVIFTLLRRCSWLMFESPKGREYSHVFNIILFMQINNKRS